MRHAIATDTVSNDQKGNYRKLRSIPSELSTCAHSYPHLARFWASRQHKHAHPLAAPLPFRSQWLIPLYSQLDNKSRVMSFAMGRDSRQDESVLSVSASIYLSISVCLSVCCLCLCLRFCPSIYVSRSPSLSLALSRARARMRACGCE